MLKNKNKLKIIALIAMLILALTLPIVRADDEPVANTEVTSPEATAENISTDMPQTTNTPGTSDENFKKNDVYLAGDNVTIDYIVDGNLFVFANNVTINSQIGGDAFICAGSVTIGEQGYVFSNLFTASKDVTINGVVYDLYAASQNTTINGYVYRDIHVSSNTVNIFGTVGRNASIDCNTLNFTKENAEEGTSGAAINGNLNYSAKEEVSIPESIVSGETTFEQQNSFKENSIQDTIMNLGTYVITVVVIWLLCLWLAPKFLKNNTSLLTTKKILPVIGLGALTPIILFTLAILFFVLDITVTLGFVLLLVLFGLIMISNAIFIITFNKILCNKLKIEKTMGTFGMLIVTAVVLWLVGLIPFVGFALGLIVSILGMGIVVSSLVLKEKEVKE